MSDDPEGASWRYGTPRSGDDGEAASRACEGGRPEAEAGHVMTTRRKIEVAVVVIGLVVLFGTIGTVLLSLFLGIG